MPDVKKNKLTDLEVREVSFVTRGAIGEKFTVIKSEDGEVTKGLSQQLNGLSDQEFTNVMRQMMQRYNEINNKNPVNKGGNNDMEEIKKMLEGFMDTVNKNFIEVNKAVENLKEKAKADEKADEKAKADEAVKKSAEAQKNVEDLSKAVGELTKTFSEVAKTVEGLAALKDTVEKIAGLKLDETLTDVQKRLDTIEKAENPSNQPKDKVNKTDGDTPKTPFWKSILGGGEE
jgi:methyl-accepting chemotaxis protein